MGGMSLGFVFAACAFALVLGCAVACVDRWREARLATSRPRPGVQRDVKRAEPARHRRAA